MFNFALKPAAGASIVYQNTIQNDYLTTPSTSLKVYGTKNKIRAIPQNYPYLNISDYF